MRRGEVYRTKEKVAERGHKPGLLRYRLAGFAAENDDISTVICAPVYSEILGLRSEVVLTTDDGLPRDSAVRCDFLTLMFKRKLTHFVGALSADKLKQLNHALQYALDLKD